MVCFLLIESFYIDSSKKLDEAILALKKELQESENKDKMKKAIDEINKANMKQIPKWITENPTYADDEEYMKIISNIMKMDGDQDKEKIINNVAQQTLIDEE